jgi:hypothetical protein
MALDFGMATDTLFSKVGAEELARALKCGVQTVKQARALEGTKSHRPPPQGWEAAVAHLARKRARQLQKLAEKLA